MEKIVFEASLIESAIFKHLLAFPMCFACLKLALVRIAVFIVLLPLTVRLAAGKHADVFLAVVPDFCADAMMSAIFELALVRRLLWDDESTLAVEQPLHEGAVILHARGQGQFSLTFETVIFEADEAREWLRGWLEVAAVLVA